MKKLLAAVLGLAAVAVVAAKSSKPAKFVPFGAHVRPGYWVHPELADAEVFDEAAAVAGAAAWGAALPKFLPPQDLADVWLVELYGPNAGGADPWVLPKLDAATGGALPRIGAALLRGAVTAGKLAKTDAEAIYKARRDALKLLGYPPQGPEVLFP